jgi:hypothetical protein
MRKKPNRILLIGSGILLAIILILLLILIPKSPLNAIGYAGNQVFLETNNKTLTVYHTTHGFYEGKWDSIYFDIIYIDGKFYKWEKIDIFDYRSAKLSIYNYPLQLAQGWHKITVKTWGTYRTHDWYGDIRAENPSCANGEYSVEGNFLTVENDFGGVIPCKGLIESVDPYSIMLSNSNICAQKCPYCDSCGEFSERETTIYFDDANCGSYCVGTQSHSNGGQFGSQCVYNTITECKDGCLNGLCVCPSYCSGNASYTGNFINGKCEYTANQCGQGCLAETGLCACKSYCEQGDVYLPQKYSASNCIYTSSKCNLGCLNKDRCREPSDIYMLVIPFAIGIIITIGGYFFWVKKRKRK